VLTQIQSIKNLFDIVIVFFFQIIFYLKINQSNIIFLKNIFFTLTYQNNLKNYKKNLKINFLKKKKKTLYHYKIQSGYNNPAIDNILTPPRLHPIKPPGPNL
jgi:hypothetical protein